MDFSFSHLRDGDGATVIAAAVIALLALLGILGLYFAFQGSVQL